MCEGEMGDKHNHFISNLFAVSVLYFICTTSSDVQWTSFILVIFFIFCTLYFYFKTTSFILHFFSIFFFLFLFF